MGTVQPYLSKQDGKRAGWRAMWRDGEGRQRSKSFDRKSDAQKHLATVEADLLRGTYIDPRAGQVTLTEYAEQWMAQQEWRQSTRTLADSHLRTLHGICHHAMTPGKTRAAGHKLRSMSIGLRPPGMKSSHGSKTSPSRPVTMSPEPPMAEICALLLSSPISSPNSDTRACSLT